jgi:hypothetical protein
MKLRHLAGVIVFGVLVAFPVPQAGAAGWLPAQPASAPPTGGATVQVNRIASNPSGAQAIAWNLMVGEGGCQSGQVTSRPFGAAWSTPSDTGCDPTVAISPTGEVLAVWTSTSADPNDDPSIRGLFVASGAAGDQLAPSTEIATTPYNIRPPRVGFAPDGTPTVAWMEQQSLSGPVDIYAATRTAGAWARQTIMAPGNAYMGSDYGAFAVGPDGSAVFAWPVHYIDPPPQTYALRAAYRAPGATTWAVEDIVPVQGTTRASGPAVAFAPDGSPTVAAEVVPDVTVIDAQSQIWTWTRAPGAAGLWQTPASVVPGTSGGSSYPVSLAIDSAGNALLASYISYWDGTYGRYNANVTERPAGGSWSAQVGLLDPAGFDDLYPPVASFDSRDTARVVFSSFSDQNASQFYAFSHPAGHGPFAPETGPPGVTGAGSPQLSVDQNGYTVATWIDAAGVPQTSVYDPIAPTFDAITPPSGGTAGQPVSFTVAGGDDWAAPSFSVNFGDGSPPATGRAAAHGLAAFGRQTYSGTVTHSYGQAGSYNAVVTLTDAVANSTTDSRAVTIAPVATTNPVTAPGTADTSASAPAAIPPIPGLPDPVLGKTFNLIAIKQPVRVKVPGAKKFVPLTLPQQLRFGAIVDATRGRVRITIAGAKGKFDTAEFYAGTFKITQRAKGSKLATLVLFGGRFKGCPRAPKPQLARKKSGSRVVRKLWGVGQGSFRTAGRFSSATIRGTTWLTEDRCNATLTRVTQGKVAVRDFVKRRTVIVRAGKRYLAR